MRDHLSLVCCGKVANSMLCVPDSDGYEFFIVSLDNKQWHFEASSSYVSVDLRLTLTCLTHFICV